MTPQEERARWGRVCIEPSYGVWGPDVHEQGRFWLVVDAECEHIARCESQEMADVLCAALEDYDRKMWAIDLPEHGC